MTSSTAPGDLSAAHVATSDALLSARAGAAALTEFPGEPPQSLEDAYRIQSRSIYRWRDEVGGWKVGGIPAPLRERYGEDWLVGPIFNRAISFAKDGDTTSMPVYVGGFSAIEPELIVKLGANRDEDRVFIGAEIASSPVPAINDYGPTAVISDFGNNNGLLIGAEIGNGSEAQSGEDIQIWIDGELVGSRSANGLLQSAFAARNFCLAHFQSQGQSLAAGTFISTGAITGIHEASAGSAAEISFGNMGTLKLMLCRAVPKDWVTADA